MLKLYFGSTNTIISTLMIIIFCVFFGLIVARRSSISHWGILVLVMFFFGLFMSFISGMKDGMGTAASLIPQKHLMMTVLCILGGLAFLAGIAAIFVRRQEFWQVSFFILSLIIIIKILLTEGFRVFYYIKHLIG